MKIYGLLHESHIFLDLKPGDKRQVLGDLVSALKQRGLISEEGPILDELLKRESLGSTGLEKGIAIPHALLHGFKEPFLALSVYKSGIEFEAADSQPTYVLLLLLGDKKRPGDQLKILAHMCRLVKETDVVEKIRKARNTHEIFEIFKEEEGKVA
ncbi:MAG: PTS sugar transporter subunit IIA [Candidatus Aminicenantales bacterium]